jgi:hypothetical protein
LKCWPKFRIVTLRNFRVLQLKGRIEGFQKLFENFIKKNSIQVGFKNQDYETLLILVHENCLLKFIFLKNILKNYLLKLIILVLIIKLRTTKVAEIPIRLIKRIKLKNHPEAGLRKIR